MSLPAKKGLPKFYLDGTEIAPPLDWQGIEITASFENDATQANITIDNFTFVLDEAKKILDHIDTGLSGGLGIFEGLPFEMRINNATDSYNAFEGYLDLTDSFEYDNALPPDL